MLARFCKIKLKSKNAPKILYFVRNAGSLTRIEFKNNLSICGKKITQNGKNASSGALARTEIIKLKQKATQLINHKKSLLSLTQIL